MGRLAAGLLGPYRAARGWVAYRRRLAALVADAERGGYRISPPVMARLRREARG